jgi:hypothetical protein
MDTYKVYVLPAEVRLKSERLRGNLIFNANLAHFLSKCASNKKNPIQILANFKNSAPDFHFRNQLQLVESTARDLIEVLKFFVSTILTSITHIFTGFLSQQVPFKKKSKSNLKNLKNPVPNAEL